MSWLRTNKLLAAIIFFDTVGFIIASYTTAVHYIGPGALVCVGGNAAKHVESSCEQVQFSKYSELLGIPVALLGLLAYGTTLTINLSKKLRGSDWGRGYVFLIAFLGFLFSLWLTSREAFAIHFWCEWCLGSAVSMTCLAFLTGYRFFTAPIEHDR